MLRMCYRDHVILERSYPLGNSRIFLLEFRTLSVFDIRNQFISTTTVLLCKNPFFKEVKITYLNQSDIPS